MPFAAAVLYAASTSVLLAIALAFGFGGLTPRIACGALGSGALVAAWTCWQARRHMPQWRALGGWEWAAVALFALFSLRAFLWVVFQAGDELRVLSPNNLGDLSLHLTYIREFANGAPFWPENPIHAGTKLTYPIGVDLFHSLLTLAGADVFRVFIWLGLTGSLLAGIALWRWGGAFTLTGFLCNGGLFGFAIFWTFQLADFQAPHAWKSIPLALFVTQRGLLFALPAGLLLLCSWRERFFTAESVEEAEEIGKDRPLSAPSALSAVRYFPLPRWGELLLYAAMPVFHFHTFLFLSLLLLVWFFANPIARWPIARFVALAFLPATALVLLITDFFQGPSVLGWQPGWMQSDADFLEWCAQHLHTKSPLVTAPVFWALNFGVLPIFVALLATTLVEDRALRWPRAVVFPALGVFALCCLVKFAPWAWDNTKVMLWAYIAVLPFLWQQLLSRWPLWARALACIALFFSGFLSLLGGLDSTHSGHAFASRSELDTAASALRAIPPGERFIAHPNFNHPLLLLGRPVVLGYTGHVWSHGYEYRESEQSVTAILRGEPGWRERAQGLGARYLFWGAQEREEYPDSTLPWRTEARRVAAGEWGEVFDLQ